MTHAELRATYPGPGLEPTHCPGELHLAESDRLADEATGHVVEVWRCRDCGARVVFDTADRLVRNDYHQESFADQVRRLGARR